MWKMEIPDKVSKVLDTQRVKLAMREAMKDTGIDLRDTLSMEPTPKKTGNLRRSNTYEVGGEGDHMIMLIKNSAPYWIWVNYGHHKYAGAHFLEQAVAKVQPEKKIVENFKRNYGTE